VNQFFSVLRKRVSALFPEFEEQVEVVHLLELLDQVLNFFTLHLCSLSNLHLVFRGNFAGF
jgi:hypothetical protein